MIKRCIDVGGALVGLIAFFPVIIAISLFIVAAMGRPIFFRQRRPGLGGQPFELIKFRTMTNRTDHSGAPLSDELRLTRFGKWLRSTSLDELPELWNVLRGDMSLVGPRPLLMAYLPLYSNWQARRHDIRPGLTGWAQINGRNAIGWEEKFALDIWYVDHFSTLLDLKIILLTIARVLARQNIAYGAEATMPRFFGSCDRSPTNDDAGTPH